MKRRKVTANSRNSNFSHMTIHGQTLGVFKRENNECIDTGPTTTLDKIKIVVFLFGVCSAMTRFSSRNTSFWRHNDLFHDEKRPS